MSIYKLRHLWYPWRKATYW